MLVAVGYRDEVMKLKGNGTRVVDLGGKTLEQNLEQLHIAVQFRERDLQAIRAVLARKTT